MTYAEKVGGQNLQDKKKAADNSKFSNKRSIIIYPEIEGDNTQIRALFQTKINAQMQSQGIGINRIKNIKNGAILVEVSDDQQATHIINDIASETDLKAKRPIQKRPHIIHILGIDRKYL